jgi:hypothetical protein
MFLHYLDPTQQKLLLGLAEQLAQIDGTCANEETLMKMLRAETGLQDCVIEGEIDPDEAVLLFTTPAARAAVCLELLGVMHADTRTTATERDYIDRVAQSLGVGGDELLLMENWVLRQIMLSEEAQQFFPA